MKSFHRIAAILAAVLALAGTALAGSHPAPFVTSEGKLIGFAFTDDAGATVLPRAITTLPTIAVNGKAVGALGAPWVTGYHRVVTCKVPDGLVIRPADVVTLFAPAGWADTPAGPGDAMWAAAVDNRAGRSDTGVDELPKTFRPGWNNAHPPGPASTYSVFKNLRLRSAGWAALTTDADGAPLTSSLATITGTICATTTISGVDQTIAFPAGLYAVGWDDTLPGDPTVCGLITWSSKILSVVERPDLNNPGAGGVGIVRVFEVRQLATTPQGGYDNGGTLLLTLANAHKSFHFANLVCYGPGDFEATPGVPVVLDRSDPLAISELYRARLRNSAGSLRWVDSTEGYGGQTSYTEPENFLPATGFTHGDGGGQDRSVPWTAARPWDPAVTPYIYSTLFGDPFPATLGAAIGPADTVLTVPDADTAPVIEHLRLKVGAELMRVLAVAGTSVTVERGSCSTVAAAHPAGPIAVQNRWQAAPQGYVYELVGAGRHGLATGQTVTCGGVGWGTFTFTDGKLVNITNYLPPVFVTGPSTIVHGLGGPAAMKTPTTLAGPVTLPAGAKSNVSYRNANIPIAAAARTTGRFDQCDLHVNVPHAASDSLVDAIATAVRDNLPADRKVFVELSNETWNVFFAQEAMFRLTSQWLYPGARGWEFHVARSAQVWQRFRDRLGPARAGQVVGLLNCLGGDTGGAVAKLEFLEALGNTTPVDIAASMYTQGDSSPASQLTFWKVDDDQAVTMFRQDLRHSMHPKRWVNFFAVYKAALDAYNLKHGRSVKLYGYEGGITCAAPAWSTTLAAPAAAGDASITVAPWSWGGNAYTAAQTLPPGTPLLLGNAPGEWAVVSGPPAGNVVPVLRGQFGSAAVDLPAGRPLRTAYLERSHDLISNPGWAAAEDELYAMCQIAGVDRLNQYNLSIGPADPGSWFGAYHVQTQMAGPGDGTAGGHDNRLVLCTPGKPGSKRPDVSAEANTDSVRGYSFNRWMKAARADRDRFLRPAG